MNRVEPEDVPAAPTLFIPHAGDPAKGSGLTFGAIIYAYPQGDGEGVVLIVNGGMIGVKWGEPVRAPIPMERDTYHEQGALDWFLRRDAP